MGYLKQVRGMLQLGESPETICMHIGISPAVLCRFIEMDCKHRLRHCDSTKDLHPAMNTLRIMKSSAIFNSSIN
jgi:hypothetical protein